MGAENVNAGFLPSDSQAAENGFKQKLKSLASVGQRNDATDIVCLGNQRRFESQGTGGNGIVEDIADQGRASFGSSLHSCFFEVTVNGPSPVQTVSEEFISEYLEVTHNSGSYEFFSGQAQAANQSRSQLSDQKNRFMHERRLVTISANQAILVEQLGTIQRDVITAQAELDQTLAEIDDVAEKLKEMPTEIVAEKKGSSDSTWSGMRQQVYMLELEERQLAAKYPADNPLLVQTREKLSGALKRF